VPSQKENSWKYLFRYKIAGFIFSGVRNLNDGQRSLVVRKLDRCRQGCRPAVAPADRIAEAPVDSSVSGRSRIALRVPKKVTPNT
jgi:hypothetical protein